jgi:hypothetical protein
VALQEQKTWLLTKKTISFDMGALVAEVEDDATAKTKLWTSTSNTREVEMPRILHVPLRLAKHMYEEGKRYTPYDVNEIITTLLYVDDAGLLPAYWEQIASWCMLAQQTESLCRQRLTCRRYYNGGGFML